MSKVILYIATSLDGFIARLDGNLDWLIQSPNPDQNDYGYQNLLANIDTVIMGRATYEEVLRLDSNWTYSDLDTYVVSSLPAYLPTTPNTHAIVDVVPFVQQLKERVGKKDVWLVGGGILNTHFLNHDLVDEIVWTIIPVILGEGIPLFAPKPKESTWELIKTEGFQGGSVQITYRKPANAS